MSKFSQCRQLCLAVVLFGVGCVGMRAVVRPPPDLVVLGKTTMAQVADRYGAPSQVLDRSFRNTRVRILQYMQAFDPSDKPTGEAYGSRAASFFFVDNVLVGHNFESSFLSDSTDFDLNLATQIKPGVTTRTQVIKALGEPGGYYQFPFEEPGLKALTYLYLATAFTKVGVGHVRREVIITYDMSDVVRKVRYQLRDDP